MIWKSLNDSVTFLELQHIQKKKKKKKKTKPALAAKKMLLRSIKTFSFLFVTSRLQMFVKRLFLGISQYSQKNTRADVSSQ